MNNPVKKANIIEYFAPEQIEELKKCKKDPFYFIESYCTVIKQGKRVPFILYPYQRRLIDAVQKFQYNVALWPRQSGKTEAVASYLLWFAMFYSNRNILIAANNFNHVAEVMRRIKIVYEELPNWIKAGVTKDGYNQRSIKFENNSTIQGTATTVSSGRGKTIDLLYIDEFAFVPPNIGKEFWAAIQPTLSSTKGKCIITSTPSADDDEFAQIWYGAIDALDEYGNEQEIGRNGFKAIRAEWYEHPDRDEEWKKEQYALVGDERWRREFEGQFISFFDTLLNPVWINENLNKLGKEPLYKTGEVRWYNELKPNKTYLLALDPSLGTGHDYSAIQVFQLPEMIQVAEWRHNRTRAKGQVKVLWDILIHIYEELKEYKPEIYWSVENNTVGETILHIIQESGEENFPGIFLTEPKRKGHVKSFRKGYNTTNRKKVEACSRLKTLLEEDKMIISSKALIAELKFYVAKGSGFEAQPGKTDDLVSSCLLVIRMMQDLMEWDADLRELVAQKVGEEYAEEIEPMPSILL